MKANLKLCDFIGCLELSKTVRDYNEGGNEENFHNMLDEITNSEWNSYIECTDEKLEDYICVQNTNVTTRLFKVEVNENLWQDEEKQIEDIKGSISFEEEIKKLDEEEITKKK